MKRAFVIGFVLVANMLAAQKATLLSGPMMGYVDYREACVWLQTSKAATVKVKYWKHKDTVYETAPVVTVADNHFCAKPVFSQVEPGNTYTYQVYLDNKLAAKSTYTFKVPALWKWRTDPPALRVAIGSCHYSNETLFDRPGTPYGDTDNRIFNTIVSKAPDVMLWLGDNVYLREPDWNSKTGIYKRYTHMRTNPALKELLAFCPNYAIWDDHDYGPNDADRGFWNKQTTLQAFKDFWANPGYGVNGQPGITGYFEWADAQFFLLDDRYYRSPDKGGEDSCAVIGPMQVQWLKDNLLYSDAKFKFIAVGSQFLNDAKSYENFSKCPRERDDIISFIQKNAIKNVIFLTGDRHHSEISKLSADGAPVIYDITASPFTSGAGNSWQNEKNTLRVEGSIIGGKRNFATLEITGERKNRKLTVTFYDKEGAELFRHEIVAEN